MGNMTMTSGSRRPRVRSPSLEPTCHPIGAFSNNNPFSTRHDFSDDDKQEMNLPVLLLESPLHIPDPRAAPIVWILREKFLKLDTLHIVTPRLALLARNDNRRYNTWYLDSCRGQHMVGSERYISNAVSTPTVTYVTVANNTRLRASAQGIVVLKARGSRTHITLNDVLIVHNLCFNLLSVAQLMDCGADLSTDPETRDIMLHYTTPNKARKQIGRAHSNNGVYILDFDIPNCSGDSQELFDLVPLDCRAPTSSTSAIAGHGLAAIAEAERKAPPEEKMSSLELEIATRSVFGTEEHPFLGPASQHLQGMLRGSGVGTFDAQNVPRPYTKEKNWRAMKWKSFANGVLRSRAAHSPGADGEKRRAPPMKGEGEALIDGARATPADGEQQLVATPADGAPHLVARQAAGALPAKSGKLPARTKGGKKKKTRQNLQEFLALMLTTVNEEEVEEAAAEPAQFPDKDPEAARARYMRTSEFLADDALWHQRLGHPSRVTLKICIEAGPGTNHYAKLEKVYSDFLNVGHCGINVDVHTLTFVDAGTRYVWIVNVEARSRAYELFRLWLAHAQRQFGEKLKTWQSDGAA
ncbi:unnamed protein product [Closterium sp. NIES-53]